MKSQTDLLNIRLAELLKFHLPKTPTRSSNQLHIEKLGCSSSLRDRWRSYDRQQLGGECVAPNRSRRKNWMFAGSDNGGNTAAILASIVATCKRLKLDPFKYFSTAASITVPTNACAQSIHSFAALVCTSEAQENRSHMDTISRIYYQLPLEFVSESALQNTISPPKALRHTAHNRLLHSSK